jgi:hypothetical protein
MGHFAAISSKTLWNLPSSSKNHIFYIVTYLQYFTSPCKVILDRVKLYKYIYFYTYTFLHEINKFTGYYTYRFCILNLHLHRVQINFIVGFTLTWSVSPKPFTRTKPVWTSGSSMDSFDDNFTLFQIFLHDPEAVNNGAISWNIFLDKASIKFHLTMYYIICTSKNILIRI